MLGDESGAPPTIQPSVSVFAESTHPCFSLGQFLSTYSHASIPEGVSAACTVASQPGSFSMISTPCGDYHVFALGLPSPARVDDYFNAESTLGGGSELISIGEKVVGCSDISLRPAQPPELKPCSQGDVRLQASTYAAQHTNRRSTVLHSDLYHLFNIVTATH
jgi:hypothetical protein